MLCMTIFSLILLFMNLIMLTLSNPMSIMLIILIQSVNISMIIWLMNKTAWFSYLLFLVFLGGLMVLFIYTTSLMSNEKFNSTWRDNFKMMIFMIMILIMINLFWPFNIKKSFMNMNMLNFITLNFSFNMVTPILLVMVYLLITLIVVVKISSKIKGPLRSTFKK
uniref:NADH dehydrogenase subunit 6 n=1 Tax=Cyphoderus aff. similis TaxID=2901280 RepID=UPI001EDD559B|nr:NADH dehydrogenase subunit 6 [Cyphoderus aff. similis]UIR97922.1 NADH dehydrogenase subunit 6 [Cyphoderus aff. similis]